MSNLDRLEKRRDNLRLMGTAVKILSRMVVITGVVVGCWKGWEVLVGSALVFLALEGAGIMLHGILMVAEEDYLDELYSVDSDDAT